MTLNIRIEPTHSIVVTLHGSIPNHVLIVLLLIFFCYIHYKKN